MYDDFSLFVETPEGHISTGAFDGHAAHQEVAAENLTTNFSPSNLQQLSFTFPSSSHNDRETTYQQSPQLHTPHFMSSQQYRGYRSPASIIRTPSPDDESCGLSSRFPSTPSSPLGPSTDTAHQFHFGFPRDVAEMLSQQSEASVALRISLLQAELGLSNSYHHPTAGIPALKIDVNIRHADNPSPTISPLSLWDNQSVGSDAPSTSFGIPSQRATSLGRRSRSLHRRQVKSESGRIFLTSESFLSESTSSQGSRLCRRRSAPTRDHSPYGAPAMTVEKDQEIAIVESDARPSNKELSPMPPMDAAIVNTVVASGNVLQANHKRRTREANHRCDVCGDTFTAKWSLQRHMNSHTEENKYPCRMLSCGKILLNPDDRKRHEKVQHDNPGPCPSPRDQRN